jgi:hypothetical protein
MKNFHDVRGFVQRIVYDHDSVQTDLYFIGCELVGLKNYTKVTEYT